MLVSCPQCSSRYQLADEKIKQTGTKVRCPRCQHTFRVYHREPEEEDVDKTELFMRRGGASPSVNETSPFKKAVTRSAESNEPRNTATETMRSMMPPPDETAEPIIKHTSPPPAPAKQKKVAEPSPFKRPEIKKPIFESPLEDDWSEASSESDQGDEHFGDVSALQPKSSHITEPAATAPSTETPVDKPRPFGDATFFEIQQMAKPKSNKRWVVIASAALVAVALFLVLTQLPQHSSAPSKVAVKPTEPVPEQEPAIKIARPSGWYRDDPSVYHDFLSQMASRPQADQKRPEARALLAEALILNGILNGADDQVAGGMSFASGLIAAHPNEIFGFYALSTYAIWREDIQTLADLVSRWPVANQKEPEYRLARMIVDGKTGKLPAAFEEGRALLLDMPEYQRANSWLLSLALDDMDQAKNVLGEDMVANLRKRFDKHRDLLKSQGDPHLPLYLTIDKKLKKLALTTQAQTPTPKPVTKEPAKPKAPDLPVVAKKPETPAATPAPSEAQSELNAMNNQVPIKPPTPAPAPAPAAPDKKPLTKLPKPSQDLVALNSQQKKDRTEATKLYNQGNMLYKQDKVNEALDYYQRALRLDPDFADVYKRLGMIYMNRQEKERALRSFKTYLLLKPEGDDKQLVEGWISSLQ